MEPQNQKIVFNACGIIAAVALVLGGFTSAANGFEAPPWLLTAELALLAALAAACCFTALIPTLLPWLQLRPVQGTLLVVCGVLAVYVPPQFIASAVLLSLGSRLVWLEACSLADAEKRKKASGTTLAKANGGGVPAKPQPAAPVAAASGIIPPPRVTRIGSVELLLSDDR